jgi:hypothetical protein
VLHVNSPAAHAQVARGAVDYLAVTARNSDRGQEALFILDLGQRKMLCWVPDPTTGKLLLQAGRVVDLKHDFGRDKSHDDE